MLGVQTLGPIVPRQVAESGVSTGVLLSADVIGVVYGASASSETPLSAGSGANRRQRRNRDLQEERDAWVVLLTVPGLGPVTFATLLEAFGSAAEVLETASASDGARRLREAVADGAATSNGGSLDTRSGARLGEDMARRIRDHAAGSVRILDVVRSLGLTVVTVDDADYPERLRRVEMPPPLLFVRGSVAALTAKHAVAVVGTRWPTDKGRLIAGWIGSSLARAGAVVVSGLAVGIDGVAHASVVSEGLATVAVLGGGHARLFPKAHERLADAIVAAGGAVVAELPPETPATRGTFPRRNRLVSGLSDATVVVEAGIRSGALITAGWALEQGRECFLVPGPMDAPTSAGCHAFLRGFPTQTRIVCGIPELLEDLGLDEQGSGDSAATGGDGPSGAGRAGRPGPVAPTAGPEAVLSSLGAVERSLAELLMAGPATADELARGSSLTGAALLSALTLLELRGLVRVPTAAIDRPACSPGARPLGRGDAGASGLQSRVLLLPAGRPGAHDLTEDRELADVVGVVIADYAHFAQDGVARGIRNRRQQVGHGIRHKLVECGAVGPETLDGQRELVGRRSGIVCRPVFLRPVGREVGAVPDVVEDVRLGDPDVLHQMPGRVGHVGRQPVDGVVGEVRHGGVERHVGAAPIDEREELLAQDVGFGHLVLGLLDSSARPDASGLVAARVRLHPRRPQCCPIDRSSSRSFGKDSR